MSAPVFLLPDLPAASAGDVIVVAGNEGHHAMAVARLRVGERVDVVDGTGGRVRGVVHDSSTNRELHVRVEAYCIEDVQVPRIVVVQAIPKSDRGDRAVELMTEVGVDVIIPWQAAHCVTRWSGERGDKAHRSWVRTAQEASKQSRRARVPMIEPACTTSQLVTLVRDACTNGARVWALHETAEADVPTAIDAPEVWLIVGPEGGISPSELTDLTAAGATAVRLGSAVFRTSSAGAIAAAVVSTLTGRWSDTHARMR